MNPDLELARAAAFGVLLASEGNEELARRYLTRYCYWPHGVMLDAVAREVALGTAADALRERIQGYTAAIERDDQADA